MPLPRVRLQTVMIAVAVAALVLALGIEATRLRRVSAQYRQKAEGLALDEENLRANAARQTGLLQSVEAQYRLAKASGPGADQKALMRQALGQLSEDAKGLHRQLDHVAALRRKYERAASRPWEAVAPDVPEPR
jgi:hypothetical protein